MSETSQLNDGEEITDLEITLDQTEINFRT